MTQYTEFIEVFFTLKMSHIFMVHAQMQFHLHPSDKYSLYTEFTKAFFTFKMSHIFMVHAQM